LANANEPKVSKYFLIQIIVRSFPFKKNRFTDSPNNRQLEKSNPKSWLSFQNKSIQDLPPMQNNHKTDFIFLSYII